ncbi:MAG: NAD(P)/FAD-dependent oxidoreductase [Candidatus Omnitrophica bacterium]|nr:NAD(P)/FAD-dependent oxidoreductase [Candidatus Omnitrophota bacterium]MDE2223463.1 NAD(P)/FAD-dependent oxidoreductase [Candidatus Omnitrophota bacterium]
MKKINALIIGAGPAGSSCALGLASAGLKVMLIDKSIFPRPKVCGGFIGPQNQELLSTLGVWQILIERGAKPLTKSVLYSSSGSVTIPIREGQALGCSRQLFDAALLERVMKEDVEVLEGAQVRRTFSNTRGFEVEIDHYYRNKKYVIYTDHLINASGWRSPRVKASHVQLGLGALYNMPAVLEQVSLFCCPRGHVGINPVEGNQVNVCYVVQEDLFNEKDCDGQKILDYWSQENPLLGRMLDGSERITPWKAVYVPARAGERFFENGIWYVGDAAAFINPVTGGGVSIALMSGRLLAKSLVAYPNDAERLKHYTEYYRKYFQEQRWLAGVWGGLAHHSFSSTAVIKLLNSNNFLRTGIINHSHPRVPNELIYQYAGG